MPGTGREGIAPWLTSGRTPSPSAPVSGWPSIGAGVGLAVGLAIGAAVGLAVGLAAGLVVGWRWDWNDRGMKHPDCDFKVRGF